MQKPSAVQLALKIIQVYYWPSFGMTSLVLLPLIALVASLANGPSQRDLLEFLQIACVLSVVIFLATLINLRSHVRRAQRLFDGGVETTARIERIERRRGLILRYQYIWQETLYHKEEALMLFTQVSELIAAFPKEHLYFKILLDPSAPNVAIIPCLYTRTGKEKLELVKPVDFATEFAFATLHRSFKDK